MKKKAEDVNYIGDGIYISKGANTPNNFMFRLHNHEDYEIYLFISGDAVYNIEGRIYQLHPYDMLFVRPDEMHRVYHNSENCIYERIIINVSDEFFEKFNIVNYKQTLIARSMSDDRKIRGSAVIERGMKEIFDRIHKLINTDKSAEPVIDALVVQLLYIMCNVDFIDRDTPRDSKIQSAIDYINEHFTEDISLDLISKSTFVSKHHLCRIFKQTTGYTVGEYINHKRLMQAAFLCKNKGMSLKEACTESGFSNYSVFYRAYKKENGASPREGMK